MLNIDITTNCKRAAAAAAVAAAAAAHSRSLQEKGRERLPNKLPIQKGRGERKKILLFQKKKFSLLTHAMQEEEEEEAEFLSFTRPAQLGLGWNIQVNLSTLHYILAKLRYKLTECWIWVLSLFSLYLKQKPAQLAIAT